MLEIQLKTKYFHESLGLLEAFNIKCPIGWEGFSQSISCYRYIDPMIKHQYLLLTHFSARFVSYGSEKATWTEARATCESLDSELVILNDKYEAEWVGSR